MKEVPLFVLNGFLESGKTTLIKEIIENNGVMMVILAVGLQ